MSITVSSEPAVHHPAFYLTIQEKLGSVAIRSDRDLAALVENRLPISVIHSLVDSGFLDEEIYRLVIPRRTLAHRTANQEPLSQAESDRAVRLARITALAEQVFGEADRSWHWMRTAKRRFQARRPIDLLETEAGARLVEEALYQIDDGMAA